MREIEIKLKAPDLDQIENKLKELGCVISEQKTQEDRNFIHKDDVKWFEPEIGEWVYPRLRIQNGEYTFTVKKPVKNELDCIEHNIQIDNPEEIAPIMKMFNYLPGVTVKKKRRMTKYKNYTITLDEVERLGSFIEIEQVVEDGDGEKMQKKMFEFAKNTFGLEKDNYVMKGYDIMMHYLDD
ncbi:MAG: class IV adenylate cyclase [Patescibacteria group bacterium]